MFRSRVRFKFKLHHAATLFIACLALAHVLITYWTIQYEEVWAGLNSIQKLQRGFKVLLVDAYKPRTKIDNRRSCPVADHVPKVALLFLATDGNLPHEAAWRSWFASAEGLLPVQQVMQGGRPPPQLGLCAKALANSRGNPLSRQWLFSAYVHRPPDLLPLPRLHAFFGHTVRSSTQASWGMHSAVTATRELLRAALKEPTNARFQLLSAATLPLWPPPVVYSRLMGETRSHLDACTILGPVPAGWTVAGVTGGASPIPKLRRSSQYFTLTRAHAALAANESRVEPLFAQACTDDADHDFRQLICSSDEYYMPTLLALSGLQDQTTCHGSVVQDNWKAGNPVGNRTRWAPADVTDANLLQLRSNRGRCQGDALIRAIKRDFQSVDAVASVRQGPLLVPSDNCGAARQALSHAPGDCFLFARRFPDDTAQAMRFWRCYTLQPVASASFKVLGTMILGHDGKALMIAPEISLDDGSVKGSLEPGEL